MVRQGEEYWRKMVAEHAASGLSATMFCKNRLLKRGTFLRWRKRLKGTNKNCGFVEVRNTALPIVREDQTEILEVRVGSDILITIHRDSDLELISAVIAAIRRVS